MNYSPKEYEPLNYKVYYVPFTKDTIYPVYVPIVVNEPDVLLSSGSLSHNDYEKTNELIKSCGFPALLPLIATLAPVVLPGLIKGVKSITKKLKGNGECGYIPTNPNIQNLKQLQNLYDKYN